MFDSFVREVIHIGGLISRTVTHVLFPIACVRCSTRDTPLCSACAQSIPLPEPSSDLIAAWSFSDQRARALIHSLKYRGRTVVASVCADALAERLVEEVAERAMYRSFQNPLIVPVPLHPRRHRRRGYNQAALIARSVARHASINAPCVEHVLERIKDTPPQARIKDKRERLRNLVGAFRVQPRTQSAITGRDIILIDDVATTGATLREAARVLKNAGAREILLCAVAH